MTDWRWKRPGGVEVSAADKVAEWLRAMQARLFAADCAARALAHVAGPDPRSVAAAAVARQLAHGGASDQELADARDAAWAAAWAAAWDAGDAARDAERAWQAERLRMYLHDERLPAPVDVAR